MKRANRRVLAEREDHPLHLTPAAEVDDVAEIAAAAGALPGFGKGVIAETGKKIRGLGKGAAASGVDIVTQSNPLVVPEDHP